MYRRLSYLLMLMTLASCATHVHSLPQGAGVEVNCLGSDCPDSIGISNTIDPTCPGPACPDQAGGNVSISQF